MPGVDLPVVPVLVSGASEAALRAQAERLRREVPEVLAVARQSGALERRDVARRRRRRRPMLAHRAVVLAGDAEALTVGLDAVVSGTGGLTGAVGAGRVAFLFTGRGTQRVGMGRGLYAAFPVFADAFDEVCGASGARIWIGRWRMSWPIEGLIHGRVCAAGVVRG